ncbi:hypothetical protein [Halocalculus aciditolerans]|uniref:Uncharacterized protein n=1 Tax=Halocalculus aciditolerans TaxID=1383812 RepID=A0A830FJG5_9EURY|nr:hypothetical protein [Halocalculus aciditolerans]GGL52947.1 hypothetical protein GCM10009039_08930 [Halocalculus aciditolerans]
MMDSDRLGRLIEAKRSNAVLAWLLVAFILLVFAESLWMRDLVWAGFTLVVAGVALVPPVVARDPEIMLPWEVVLLAALPVLARTVTTWGPATDLATSLSIAALALLVAVELDVFTPVRMTPWFAIAFTVIATMATAGLWAVGQWLADLFLGTYYVLPPPGSGMTEGDALYRLMWDFVGATGVGLVAGVVFEWYFRRVVDSATRIEVVD